MSGLAGAGADGRDHASGASRRNEERGIVRRVCGCLLAVLADAERNMAEAVAVAAHCKGWCSCVGGIFSCKNLFNGGSSNIPCIDGIDPCALRVASLPDF